MSSPIDFPVPCPPPRPPGHSGLPSGVPPELSSPFLGPARYPELFPFGPGARIVLVIPRGEATAHIDVLIHLLGGRVESDGPSTAAPELSERAGATRESKEARAAKPAYVYKTHANAMPLPATS